MGEEESEREKGEERCSATMANTLHMNNRVRSVIPPRRLLHWQTGQYQLSLQEDYTP